jgi:hypothetical protein
MAMRRGVAFVYFNNAPDACAVRNARRLDEPLSHS